MENDHNSLFRKNVVDGKEVLSITPSVIGGITGKLTESYEIIDGHTLKTPPFMKGSSRLTSLSSVNSIAVEKSKLIGRATGVGTLVFHLSGSDPICWENLPNAEQMRDFIWSLKLNTETKSTALQASDAASSGLSKPTRIQLTENSDRKSKPCAKYTDELDEYLDTDENPIVRASEIFQAGEPEIAFQTTRDIGVGLRLILLWIFLGKEHPCHKFGKHPHEGRNWLIVFQESLVRCTLQQYHADKQKDHFYFTGVPLHLVSEVGLNSESIWVRTFLDDDDARASEKNECMGLVEFGGPMNFRGRDKELIASTFRNLKSEGRLHHCARIEIDV